MKYRINQTIGQEAMCAKQAYIDHNPTVRENLEQRIAKLEQELANSKASLITLGPLLDMRICDIRDAMNY